MANTWFRMYSDFLNDPKMISLAFEDQRHFIAILALKSDGTIDQKCEIKLLDRIVAQKLWIDFAIISDVKKRLIDAGLIDSEWQPLAWSKRQYVSDSSTERTRKYREKIKNNLTENKETSQKRHGDALDTDTDTDTDIDTDTEYILLTETKVSETNKSEIKKEEKQRSNTKQKKILTSFPENFEVTLEMCEWAVSEGVPEAMIKKETQKFKDYCLSKDSRYKDWLATWRNWMRNAVLYNYKRTA